MHCIISRIDRVLVPNQNNIEHLFNIRRELLCKKLACEIIADYLLENATIIVVL